MTRYRKRQVVIEAWRWTGDADTSMWPLWLTSGKVLADYPRKLLFIHTLEGVMEARAGDWIIKGVEGEVYPCKPSIFEATYEAVDGEQVSHYFPTPTAKRRLIEQCCRRMV